MQFCRLLRAIGCIDRPLEANLFRRSGDPTAALKG
jgi:hypothetical protein